MDRPILFIVLVALLTLMSTATHAREYDVIIRNGTVYDGSGKPPVQADVAIDRGVIASIGKLDSDRGKTEINARGLAVAPGFINMLSWAPESLIQDGRSQSDICQGVTLEVMGEGESMGPWNDDMKRANAELQGDIKYKIEWTTLDEYLRYVTNRGVSCNVASFVGAATVRQHVLGHVNRKATPEEIERMKGLVRQAMQEGAMGVASALIYAPGSYADTEEMVELARVAAEFDGMYISHIRSEGDRLLEAADELIDIARRAKSRAEFYHLKALGQSNWGKLDDLIRKIEAARADGLHVTADMYMYAAAATGLDATMPTWVQEGGLREWIKRMKDPATRARLKKEMSAPGVGWENMLVAAGKPDNVLIIGCKSEKLKPMIGRTLGQIAAMRGTSAQETAMDLVIEDDSRIECVYFVMSEENVRKQLKLPWVSFCSDADSSAPEGVFLKSSRHPRAYGNFARLLGKYVRDEKIVPMEEAIRRLTSLPAENLKIKNRGSLLPGYFGDLVVFDPAKVQDHATFEKPMQYSSGVLHVFVNGVQVLKDGEHTGAKPGQVVRGPGA